MEDKDTASHFSAVAAPYCNTQEINVKLLTHGLLPSGEAHPIFGNQTECAMTPIISALPPTDGLKVTGLQHYQRTLQAGMMNRENIEPHH